MTSPPIVEAEPVAEPVDAPEAQPDERQQDLPGYCLAASARARGCRRTDGRVRRIPPAELDAFLVTFPEEGGDPWNLGQRWSSYGSPQGDWSLGVATFYSHVGPRAGGRLIVEGSHRLLQSFFEQLKPSERLSKRLSDRFFRSHPYFAELTGKTPPKPERVRRFMGEETEIDGVAVRVLELTGEPGDAVLYHRGLVSSISRNVSQETAFMRG